MHTKFWRFILLSCDAMWIRGQTPIFRKNIQLLPSKITWKVQGQLMGHHRFLSEIASWNEVAQDQIQWYFCEYCNEPSGYIVASTCFITWETTNFPTMPAVLKTWQLKDCSKDSRLKSE
jgi:hypothetical protein